VEALVEHPGGAPHRRGQIPDGTLEQILARVLHPRGLRAGERMTPDEAPVDAGVRDHALGRSHVADDTIRAGASERQAHRLAERPDRHGHEHDVGALHGAGDVRRDGVDRTDLECLGEHPLVGVIPTYVRVCAPPCGQAD
jgi:hypothetical protein